MFWLGLVLGMLLGSCGTALTVLALGLCMIADRGDRQLRRVSREVMDE